MNEAMTYAGIDYGFGRSNIDPTTGIRFGVISQNSVMPEAMDDVWSKSRDLTFEAAQAEFKDKLHYIENADMLKRLCDNYGIQHDLDTPEQLTAAELWDELEESFNEAYSMADCGDRDWLYESDGYKLTNCLTSDVMVLASPYFTHAQFCSPCVPGGCNLDLPLDTGLADDGFDVPTAAHAQLKQNRCYCLGHDWFDGGKAPYPVYSVETGELVN